MRRSVEATLDGEATMDFVHASPRRPINEYIFPDDVYTNPAKVRTLFEKIEHVCFVGHTHMPGVFLDEPDFYLPDELGGVYPIVEDEKAIINIGSVGQPRDKDNRASYVYVDGEQGALRPARIRFRDDDEEDPRHRPTGQIPRGAAARRKVRQDAHRLQASPILPHDELCRRPYHLVPTCPG